LDDELDNFRAAISWALDNGESEAAARIAGALWSFMWTRGYLTEARRWLESALQSKELSVPVRAGALRACGILAHDQGDYPRAQACFQEALDLRRQLDDKGGVAGALNALGVLLLNRGEYEQSRAYYEEALSLFQQLGDSSRIAVALNNLGVLAERLHDYTLAGDYYRQSLDLARRLDDREGTAWALDNLGNISYLRGDYSGALPLLQKSLTLFKEIGSKQGIVTAIEHIAGVAGASGQPLVAAGLFGAAELLREQTGAVVHPARREAHEQRISKARSQVDDASWQSAWSEGRAMSAEAAAQEALSIPLI
jgi:tetratricopeptide (TPR) repeat protein